MNKQEASPELAARIDLAREDEFALGAFRIRPSTLEVLISERRQVLQPRVMQVLVALARRSGQVVSRDELIWSCWDGLSVSDHAINRCISQLRRLRAVGVSGFNIETIPRVGYRLTIPPVAEPEVDEGPASKTAMDAPQQRASGLESLFGRHRTLIGAAAVLIIGVGAWISYELRNPAAETRVIVLPAQISGTDPVLRRFAAGLTNRIVNVLGETDVSAIRTDEVPPGGIGFAVKTEVESDKDQLHIDLGIDRISDGATLWSQEFKRNRGEANALQLQVAARAADAITFSSMCSPASDTATLSLCVRAAQLLRTSDFPRARILLQELVSRLPKFGLAHELLASAALGEKAITHGDQRRTLLTEAHDEAQRAQALDSSLIGAHRVLSASLPTRQWTEKEAELRKALKPGRHASRFSESNANAGLGRLLLDAGRASEAAPFIQQATTLDPLSASKVAMAAASLEANGRLSEAKSLLTRAASAWPDDFALALYRRYFMLMYGSGEEASVALDDSAKLFPLRPAAVEALQAFIVARTAKDPSSIKKAAEALSKAAQLGSIDRRLVIPALATIGAIDAALAEADQLLSDDYAETTVLFSPASELLRRDPRFMALAKRVGLSDYWRNANRWPDFCKAPEAPYDCTTASLIE